MTHTCQLNHVRGAYNGGYCCHHRRRYRLFNGNLTFNGDSEKNIGVNSLRGRSAVAAMARFVMIRIEQYSPNNRTRQTMALMAAAVAFMMR